MKKEIHILLTAVMFYTRIPCPSWIDHSDQLLQKSTRYFPLIGVFVGSISALVLFLCQLIFPISISIVLSMLTSILITGAFHEDGLADVCDAFGGGWTKEKILEIMKDSRIGTFGVVGLVISLLSKFILTYELTEKSLLFALGGIILSHSLSRVNATGMIFIFNYARADASSKTKPVAKKLSLNSFLVAVLLGFAPLVPFYLEFGPLVFIVIFPLLMLLFYLKGYFNKWIGGYTGDCLGTVQQLSEILVLLFLLGIWKYI